MLPLGCFYIRTENSSVTVYTDNLLITHSGLVTKAQVLLITLTTALFCSSVLARHDSVTVSQREQYREPETEAAKWRTDYNICCAFLTVKCQNVLCEGSLILGIGVKVYFATQR